MKITLHFGMPKTGSSYLQSMLAINQEALLKIGVDYPSPNAKSIESALSGHISSGHGGTDSTLPLVDNWLRNGAKTSSQHLLLSSELWFADLVNADGLFWNELRSLPGGLDIQLVGFARDPFWAEFSSWGQAVKRGRLTKSFDDLLSTVWAQRTNSLAQALETARGFGFELRILNYSRHQFTLWDSFLGLVEIDPTISSWKQPRVPIVNRSLHWAETVVVMEANRLADRRSGRLIADAFCNYAPAVKPSGPALQKATFDTFLREARIISDQINRWMPAAEKLDVGIFDTQWERDYFAQRHQSQIHLPLASWRAIVKQVVSVTGSAPDELEDCLLHGLEYQIRADENDGLGYLFMAKNDVPQLVGNIRDIASQNSPDR